MVGKSPFILYWASIGLTQVCKMHQPCIGGNRARVGGWVGDWSGGVGGLARSSHIDHCFSILCS